MATPARSIEVLGTSIHSSSKIRSNHDQVNRFLTSAKIPFTFTDVSMSEAGKMEWKRKGMGELPCVLSGGERCGSVEELAEAVEFGELRQFLKLDQALPTNPVNPDDALLSGLSAADANALAAELSSTVSSSNPLSKVPNSASETLPASTASIAAASAQAAAECAGPAGIVEKPIEPVPTPTSPPFTTATPSVPTTGKATEETVMSPSEVGLAPKDEVAMKHDAEVKDAEVKEDVTEQGKSIPTVPSEQVAEALLEAK